jgi:hypothetical protein
MTCEDYLSMLETLPVEELAYGAARDHAAQCYDCKRVTRVVAARERNMTLAYAEAYPSASAVTVAERSIEVSRRRRVAFFVRAALGAAAVVTLFGAIVMRRGGPSPAHAVSMQTFRLQCLSPQQAAEMLRQKIPHAAGLSVSAFPSSQDMWLRVEGPKIEVAAARSVLDRFDTPARSQCAAELTPPRR